MQRSPELFSPPKAYADQTVSVIVPVLNDLRIGRCLRSLLAQDYPAQLLEIIVVDNASHPRIQVEIERFPVKYLLEPRRGAYHARNCGLAYASGTIVAFTDADCWVDPSWIRLLLAGFESDSIGAVGGSIRKSQPDNWIQAAAENLADGQITTQHLPFFPAPYLVTANVAYRREVLDALGGFDGRFQSGGDVDIAWRTYLRGYSIAAASKAIVHHDARSNVVGYFRQFFKYAVGHALLYRKYRSFTGTRFYVHTYSMRGFLMAILSAICILPQALLRRKDSGLLASSALALVKYIALLMGGVYGAVRYRSPYI